MYLPEPSSTTSLGWLTCCDGGLIIAQGAALSRAAKTYSIKLLLNINIKIHSIVVIVTV